MSEATIPGGYILLARKLLDSGIMAKPPLFIKLWIWMLGKASFKDHGDLKRGQFFSSYKRMQKAMGHKVGYRSVKPTVKEIRGVTKFLTKVRMVVITKVTHGMVITILNYKHYQDFKNYEGHNEGQTQGHIEGTIPRRKGLMNEKNKTYSSDSNEIRLSKLLQSLILSRQPKNRCRKSNLQTWAKHIGHTIRIDGRTPEELEKVIQWCQQDSFWQHNIQSTDKLRDKFDQLEGQMNQQSKNNNTEQELPVGIK